MGRLPTRLSAALAAAGLAGAGLVAAAAPANAAACSGTSGVTVVIDTGSSVSTRCASGGGSAMAALTSVASVVSPQQFPGSVVCRIDGVPASDPCVRMPPSSAYWGFFHAPRGGSWTYSSDGVASYSPAAGSVIGFRFGSGQQPRTAPPAPTATVAPTPTPKPTTPRATPKPPTAPSTSGGSTAGSGAAATPGARGTATPSTSASPAPSASASASPSTPTSGAPSATPSGSAGEQTLAASPTSSTTPTGGPGAGTLASGLGLVVLVSGGAVYAARRRRA